MSLPAVEAARAGAAVVKPTPRDRGERAKKRRLRFLRANPLCQACLAVGKATPAVELDHCKPLHLGGADDESNFAAMCRACHLDKTLRERGITPRVQIGTDGWPVQPGDASDRGGDQIDS